jgi:hypothetical protein
MEPANVNLPPDEDAQLAALLRATHAEIPDDGFSSRVLAVLPPVQHSASTLDRPFTRIAIYTVSAIAGLAFAIARGLSFESLAAAQETVRQTLATVSATPDYSSVGIALAAATLSILYAMKGRLVRLT